jgi:hypothetical protein
MNMSRPAHRATWSEVRKRIKAAGITHYWVGYDEWNGRHVLRDNNGWTSQTTPQWAMRQLDFDGVPAAS